MKVRTNLRAGATRTTGCTGGGRAPGSCSGGGGGGGGTRYLPV
jgi:hypothetical protein